MLCRTMRKVLRSCAAASPLLLISADCGYCSRLALADSETITATLVSAEIARYEITFSGVSPDGTNVLSDELRVEFEDFTRPPVSVVVALDCGSAFDGDRLHKERDLIVSAAPPDLDLHKLADDAPFDVTCSFDANAPVGLPQPYELTWRVATNVTFECGSLETAVEVSRLAP